ncbi:MAG: nucleotidyltransferase domain-containing protein, partial [Candidatus Aenigmatarchaeota archaeon]
MYLLDSNNNSESIEQTEVGMEEFGPESSKRISRGFDFIEQCEGYLPEMSAGAIFGSTARDEASIESDIDIALIFEGDADYGKLCEKIHPLVTDERRYEISPHLVSEKDLEK